MADEVVTISGPIIQKIEEVKSKYKNALNPLPSMTIDSIVPSGGNIMNALNSKGCLPDNWTKDFFITDWVTPRTIIIENINKLVIKAKEAVDQILFNLQNQPIIDVLIVKILDLTEEFIKKTIQPLDEILIEISYKYNDIIRMWRDLKKTSKEVKEGLQSKEYKQQKLKELTNRLAELDENIAFLISLLFLVDSLSEMMDDLKEMVKTEKGAWNRLVDKFKDQYSMLKALTDKFGKNGLIGTLYSLIFILLPLIASLAAAFLCSNQTDAKIRQASSEKADKELKANGVDPDDENGEKEQKKLEQLYSNLSTLLEYALKDLNGYSLKYNDVGDLVEENTNIDDQGEGYDQILVSVCQVEDLSDSLEKEYDLASKPERYVLELGKDLSGAYFDVSKGNSISIDQTIGYYKQIPIKSVVDGIVIDKKSKHIIVESATTPDNIVDKMQNVANNIDYTDQFSSIVDKFKKINYIETYLTDFALPCRYPNLMMHSSGKGSYAINLLDVLKGTAKNSKYRLIDDYKEAVDQVTNDYKYKIKDICSADKVKTSCENRQNDQLKDKIFSEKKQGIRNIINFYNTWINYTSKYCADEEKTYLLLTEYTNYLTDVTFDYNDDNPYVVEQFNLISGFIKDRINAESSNRNILIDEFNSRCRSLLYAKLPRKDYYSYFAGKFYSDWYVQDDKNIIGVSNYAKKDDETYDSLYKKMYNYIMDLLGSPSLTRDNKTFDTDKITDINAFLKSNAGSSEFDSSEKDIIAKQNSAKSVVKYFMIIRQLSTYSYYNYKISLKDRTRNEARLLDQLTNKVIAEYNKPENFNFYNNIDKMFDSYKKVNCPYKGIIYINNYIHDHYVYSSMTDTDMNPYNKVATDDELMDRLSPKTAHTPFQLPYWLIYCAEATLVNVLIPLYWSTGLIIMGTPILLPIIYLPIYFLPGSVSVLFGLGICGIAIWPMLVFINNTAYSSTTLLPVTIAIDFIKKGLKSLGNASLKTLTLTAKPLISTCDAEIYQLEEDLKQVNIDITNQKNYMAGIDFNKVNSTILPNIPMTNSVSSMVNEIFNKQAQKINASTILTTSSNIVKDPSVMSEIRSDDGLYHNIVVCLDPASGKKLYENKSPYTAHKMYPSAWKETKKPSEKVMDFSEYKWSLDVCKQIKAALEPRGIEVYITNNGSTSMDVERRCRNAYNHMMSSEKHHLMVSIAVNAVDPDDNKWKNGISGWSIYTSKREDGLEYYQDSVALAEFIYDNAVIKFKPKNMNMLTNLNGNWKLEKNEYYKKYKIRHQEEDYTITRNDYKGKQNMPTVLSKNFYCDNIDDLAYLNTEEGKTDISTIHVNGILSFIAYKGWA